LAGEVVRNGEFIALLVNLEHRHGTLAELVRNAPSARPFDIQGKADAAGVIWHSKLA
jgi:hypothetical protein